jgi:hypothetical protein
VPPADYAALQTADRYDEDELVAACEPTEDYLNALLQQEYLAAQPQRDLDREVEALLDDVHDLGLPTADKGLESEEFRGGWAMELVQRIKQFWPNVPQVQIPSGDVGAEPESFANDLEEALNALIQAQDDAKRGPGGNFFDAIKGDVVAYGRGYAALLPVPRLARDFPAPPAAADLDDPDIARLYNKRVADYGKGKLPPLALRHLPVRDVQPVFDDDGLCEVFWITYDRAWQVLQRAKARGVKVARLDGWLADMAGEKKGDKSDLMQLVPIIHYANRKWMAELVGTPRSWPPTPNDSDFQEGVELLGDPWCHGLDRLPVVYFHGMTTPLYEPHQRAVSAVYSLRNVILMLDRMASMKATAVRIWCWPTPMLRMSLQSAGLYEAGMFEGRPRPVEIEPGMMLTLWPDEEVSFLTWQGNAPDQDEVLTLLKQQFDRLGLPSVESGAGGDSGYAIAQLRAAARGKWGVIEGGLSKGWKDLAWLELGYLAMMPHDVWVPTVAEASGFELGRQRDERTRSRTAFMRIKPDQIRKRTFVLHAKLEPDRSLDLIANVQAASGLRQLGLPLEYILEHILGIQNTTRIKTMMMQEKLEQTEGYDAFVFAQAYEQARLILHNQQQVGPEDAQLTPEDLMQLDPAQLQALVAAGMVPAELAQMVMAQQGQNAFPGQVLGALAGGAAPPTSPAGPFPGAGGAPSAALAGTGVGGGVPMPTPAAGALGALGGAPSPAANFAPPTPNRGGGIPGRGRAAGQSRAPAQRGAA